MEENVIAPVEPEQLPEETVGETVELIEAPADLTPIVDGLAKLQQTADAQVALLGILCGLVLGGFCAIILQHIWRK